MLVAVIGPDGCGKTTVVNRLIEALDARSVNATHSAMHFEILPQLKDLINPFLTRKIDSSHIEGEYHIGMKSKPHSAVRGSLYVLWYTLDYILGNLRLFRPRKKGDIMFFARYYYDYYFQRVYLNTPYLLIRFCEFFVPIPSLIITIGRSPEEIFALKPELSIKEIKRQQKIINDLFIGRKNAYIVDGSVGIDNTVQQVLELIESVR